MPPTKPILCLDFDGVCHSYTTPFESPEIIPDPHVPGLFEFLQAVRPHFDVQVFSARTGRPGVEMALYEWFHREHRIWRGAPPDAKPESLGIWMAPTKPAAMVALDDRALTFNGTWPDVRELLAFKPWNRR